MRRFRFKWISAVELVLAALLAYFPPRIVIQEDWTIALGDRVMVVAVVAFCILVAIGLVADAFHGGKGGFPDDVPSQ